MHHVAGENQSIHLAGEKRVEGVVRGGDDGLTPQVEGSVEDDRDPGCLTEEPNEVVVAWVGLAEDGLEPGAVVDVSHRRHPVVLDRHDQQHESRRVLACALAEIEEALALRGQYRGSEWTVRLAEL